MESDALFLQETDYRPLIIAFTISILLHISGIVAILIFPQSFSSPRVKASEAIFVTMVATQPASVYIQEEVIPPEQEPITEPEIVMPT